MLRPLLALLVAATLAGCAAISSLNSAAATLDAFELRAPAGVPVARSQQGIDFIVEVPSASGAIDSDRILVRPSPRRSPTSPTRAGPPPRR
jgi:cholesterol transport system auxiliary component